MKLNCSSPLRGEAFQDIWEVSLKAKVMKFFNDKEPPDPGEGFLEVEKY